MKTKQLKYIIINDVDTERAILFDANIIHADVYDKSKIVSAGFCILRYDDRFGNGLIIEVGGDSSSLQIRSRPEDRNIIYQSMMAGAWDYHIKPDDPAYTAINKMIKQKEAREDLKENEQSKCSS